ncbi:hypothetical protein KEM56_001382, partial [Ascosphaera pollenicola]
EPYRQTMARTRSAPRGKQAPSSPSTDPSRLSKGIEHAPPTKTLILPKNITSDARLVMLDNPATEELSRYLYCPREGVLELTVIETAKEAPRSVLFTSTVEEEEEDNGSKDLAETANTEHAREDCAASVRGKGSKLAPKALISKSAQFLVATQVDLLFFVLPILLQKDRNTTQNRQREERQKLFQPLDDMLELRDDISRTLKGVLLGPLRPRVQARITTVCDTVDAGETMFRLNEEKLVQELVFKAQKALDNGKLPASMEEKFVTRALEAPMVSVKREDIVTDNLEFKKASEPLNEEQPTSTDDHQPDAMSEPDEEFETLKHLLRLRTALSFILSSYVPEHIRPKVEAYLNSPTSPIDFTPLTKRLSLISELRAQAAAAAAMNNNISRKRSGLNDDDMFSSKQDTKKLKQEEEKKAKTKQSRAVRDLKKADTSGMKKLSSFFGKR